MADDVEPFSARPIHPFSAAWPMPPATAAPSVVASDLSPEEAGARTPPEDAAHERAQRAEALVRELSDACIRIEHAHFRVDRATIAGWREANAAYEHARAECDAAKRIDNSNDQRRMERQRQAQIREGERVKARWAEEERETAELRRARAGSLPGRIGRLMGRE